MTLAALVDTSPSAVEFRQAMASFATGVTVVTTTSGRSCHGMTVNAFCSVSLDPLLLLVSLRADCRGLRLIESSRVFTVNVLTASQQSVSQWFASPARPADSSMFDGMALRTGATGCPVLLDAAASFDCVLDDLHAAGDHVLVVGEVVDLSFRTDAEPLVFHAGSYCALTRRPRLA